MAKLYAPQIDNILPAFTNNTIIIPFQFNRAVGILDVVSISMIMRSANTNTIKLADLRSTIINQDIITGQWQATFVLSDENMQLLTQNSFYKIQLAFVDTTQTIGYYSSTGVIKYTMQPLFGIRNLTTGNNLAQSIYIGYYDQTGLDTAEKIYSYSFNLYDAANKLIETSGELIHNYNQDINLTKVEDKWSPSFNLIKNKWYFIEYNVVTINNLRLTSPKYRIIQTESYDIEDNIQLSAQLNYEEGYINLSILTTEEINNTYIIKRASSVTNYMEWDTLGEIKLNISDNMTIWKDFTIEHGMSYKYALQTKNYFNIYSNLLYNIEGIIEAVFEDMFLYDGEKQLKIRFNPRVGSFKINIPESKTDTLGSQYPYFFRNGKIHYKEFPISGLLSLLSDSESLFIANLQYNNTAAREQTTVSQINFPLVENDTQLSDRNIYRERQFKIQALDWLTNGKPKLFRSPTEGNFIVRLMNVSLTPNDTLGRMLHTFNSTAYEIADTNSLGMQEYGFFNKTIDLTHDNNQQLIINAVNLNTALNETGEYNFNGAKVNYLNFDGQYFNDLILQLIDELGNDTIVNIHNITGVYNVTIDIPIVKILYVKGVIDPNTQLIYGYYSQEQQLEVNGNTVRNISITDCVGQYIGAHNIYSEINTDNSKLNYVYLIRFLERPVEPLYYLNGKYYYNNEYTQEYEYNNNFTIYEIDGQYAYDPSNLSLRLNAAPDYSVHINDQVINLQGGSQVLSGRIELKDYGEVNTLTTGSGVITDIVYQLQTISTVQDTQSYIEEINESGGTTIYIKTNQYTENNSAIEI